MRDSRSDRWFIRAIYILVTLITIVSVYPFLYVVFASFSDPLRLTAHEGFLVAPLGFTLKGYELVLKNPNILRGYMNTAFYVLLGTGLNMLLTIMGAYAVSKRALLIKPIMFLFIFTMFFGGGLIPWYLLVLNLNLMDTRTIIILTGAVNMYNLIIMRTAFVSIPSALFDSAKIDGAGHLRTLISVVIPVSKPTLAAITLFYAVERWNSWFPAMLFLRDRTLFPLQLVLREILINNDKSSMTQMTAVATSEVSFYNELLQYSTIIVATVPILLLYPFLQKYFVKGVMIGSIKG